MNKLIQNLDLKGGIIRNLDAEIDPDILLVDQISNLREDLLQIEYPDKNFIIDVGWYPSFSEEGAFQVVLIRGQQWGDPLLKGEAKDFPELLMKLQEAADYVSVQPNQ